ncbi:MAG: 4-alpha-glucanotransferase [Bacteroidetes bacterium]|nr:MAG: 4-alpha-glucanotransferase [Bacteroidota bacterium]
MKIHFYLRFHTKVGESIYVTGNIHALGNGDNDKAFPLQFMNDEFWHGTIEVNEEKFIPIEYSYLFKTDDGTLISEWGADRVISDIKPAVDEIQVVDTWNYAGEFENAFFTAPFQDILLVRHKKANRKGSKKPYTHVFKVKAPLLKKDEAVCLTGSGNILGEWNQDSSIVMNSEGKWWTIKINLPRESFPLHYKYGVYDTKHKKFLGYEQGENRVLYGDALEKKITVLHDGFAHLPNNTWRGAGVSIPVFSLRSKNSCGVGEFADIRTLVDWAKKVGLKLIQILPVNDTSATHTWQDSYPYAAISAFALHPIYLNLEGVAGKKHAALLKPHKKTQKSLNVLPELDYEAVMKHKLALTRELYLLEKDEFFNSDEYRDFFNKNEHWLVPYAAFCYLRDRNGTSDFTNWKTHSRYDKDAIAKFVSPKAKHYDEIALQYFTQYHLHLQLRDATDYAHQHGIIVKGDIPIGIYRHSCDAWIEPGLYHMEVQAGAPPDDFAVKGQNWGFPTYNWEQMAKDGFGWWKRRFEQMANYFDAFRIDHILGFFRIWSIPMDAVDGVMGHFDPVLPVHINEFRDRHIWFDIDRYTKPFINEAVLWEFFENDWEKVSNEYLEKRGDGSWGLKESFSTQRKVECHFSSLEKNELNDKIKSGLLGIISNVILFEVPESKAMEFNFRIAMDHTSSFRYLEWGTQQQLKDLYVNYFYRRQDHFWQMEAMKKLPALKHATNMLVCGEDLGMVPHCVPDVMRQLGILSLEIQRMPKDPKREFGHPADMPYLSVVTPSTHDMSTIRGWWEEDRNKTQRFYNYEMGQWGDAPSFCEPWINKAIVIQHLHSPAMWSVFQMQDLLGIDGNVRRENPHDERINVPANSKHFWKYRMHLLLEDLIGEKEFNEQLKEQVHSSGRA